MLVDRIINGAALGSETTGELLSVRIIHNNAEGVVAFLTKFIRDLRGHLEKEFSTSWAVEILRSRILTEVQDDRVASRHIASATYARYDCLPREQKNEKAAVDLIQQIETSAENMYRYRTQKKPNNLRNRNNREQHVRCAEHRGV